jgi:hypothetical protein
MNRILLVLTFLLVPTMVFAASTPPSSFSAAWSLLEATALPGSAYAAGGTVTLTAPVGGDFSAVGGSIIAAAPIKGEALFLGGSVDMRSLVGGSVRAIAGNFSVEQPVTGDLVVLGATVLDAGRASGSVFIVAQHASVTNGAGGPVTIYGSDVSLAGNFAGDVQIITSGRLSIASTTVIHGTLSYQSPEEANIPSTASILGGVTYTNASYLPSTSTSRTLAFVSIGVFLLVRILGGLILAGLLAGLFPTFAESFSERVYGLRPRSILLTTLLGFAALIVTPVLLLLLLLTFVGIGLALLLGIVYTLVLFVSFFYAGILMGALLARLVAKREQILWRDGVIGMFVFSLITLIPLIGWYCALVLVIFTLGNLLLFFFHFAFSREGVTNKML